MGKSKVTRRGRGGGESSFQETYPPHFLRQKIREAIRKVWSLYSPERKQALWNAKTVKKRTNKDGTVSKVPDVYFRCATCGDEFKQTDVQVDHVTPLGKTPDFPPNADETDWVNWMLRLFCGVENLQVVCKPCHRTKTLEDNRNTRRRET